MLINPHTSNITLKNFPHLYEDISKHYDLLYDTVPDQDYIDTTPRFKLEHGGKMGFRDIFYYINLLYDNNPGSVVDIGCGECIWKTWFPNIIGFDPTPSKWSRADFVDTFDEDFSNGHNKNYDCGLALNSIHFIDWSDITKQIELAMNIVRDRFLFTFNFGVFTNKPDVPLPELILLFDDILNSVGYKIILLDYPYLRNIPNVADWGHINGHVRFILEHN